MRTLIAIVSFSSLAALLVSCGGSSNPTSPSGGTTPAATVTIQDFSFSPNAVTVKVGQTVRWINQGPSSHTTTSDNGVWDSGAITPNTNGGGGGGSGYGMSASTAPAAFDFTFTQAGTFGYHCSIHPPAQFPGFTGTVTVTP